MKGSSCCSMERASKPKPIVKAWYIELSVSGHIETMHPSDINEDTMKLIERDIIDAGYPVAWEVKS